MRRPKAQRACDTLIEIVVLRNASGVLQKLRGGNVRAHDAGDTGVWRGWYWEQDAPEEAGQHGGELKTGFLAVCGSRKGIIIVFGYKLFWSFVICRLLLVLQFVKIYKVCVC